jgi:hypothetical protein
MALAERVDLARCVGRGTLVALRLDSEPRVLEALLDNRFVIEADVIQASIHGGATETTLALIAAHPRWSLRPGVRSALLRNPSLPLAVALGLLPRASRADLDGILESPHAAEILKACAERLLARRLSRV